MIYMVGFEDPALFGDRWADLYDGSGWETPPELDLLAELAAGGRVLELAIGTGRVAVPLARRGIAVEGIEASAAMVDKMRDKPGGADIPVVIGDMADVAVDGPFAMAYLVYNTLFNLITQERQIDCFRNVAQVLEPGGAFVIECFVPDPTKWDRGQRVEATSVTADNATLNVYHHDPVAQRYHKQTIIFDADGYRMLPTALRYSWPTEIDLMARLAGLHLHARFGDWQRRPFTVDSTSHVSIYRKAAANTGS
jgi:SAM-dependent methyltransferase